MLILFYFGLLLLSPFIFIGLIAALKENRNLLINLDLNLSGDRLVIGLYVSGIILIAFSLSDYFKG